MTVARSPQQLLPSLHPAWLFARASPGSIPRDPSRWTLKTLRLPRWWQHGYHETFKNYYCCVYKHQVNIYIYININQYHLLCLTSRISGPPTFATYLEDSLQQQPPANLLNSLQCQTDKSWKSASHEEIKEKDGTSKLQGWSLRLAKWLVTEVYIKPHWYRDVQKVRSHLQIKC